ncbi:unnamed protein product [Knipowitschia caucasica]
MAKAEVSSYFKMTSLPWIISVTLSVGFFTCIVFAPELIPYRFLGPFGTFCRNLVDNHAGLMYKGWWVAFAIHVLEALYSLKVCSDKGITAPTAQLLWFFQTFLFGITSLGILLKFDPRRPKQQ